MRETFTAYFAFEVLFAGVDFEVVAQLLFVREAFVADLTFVVLFAYVDLEVVLELLFL